MQQTSSLNPLTRPWGRLLPRLLLVGVGLVAVASLGLTRCGNASVPQDVALKKGQAILGRMEARMNGMKDFTARLQASVRVHLLPAVGVAGKVYFKRPNQVKVEIDHLPRWVERFRRQFSGLSPNQREKKDYVARYDGDEVMASHPCFRLVLSPRDAGSSNLQEVRMWVDQKQLTVVRAIARYTDGSEVTSDTKYSEVGRFLLPASQETRITTPRAAADVSATYSDYRVNQNLPDSVFQKGPK